MIKDYFLVPSAEYEIWQNKYSSDRSVSVIYSKTIDKNDHHSRSVARKEYDYRDRIDNILTDGSLAPDIADKLHIYLSHLYTSNENGDGKKPEKKTAIEMALSEFEPFLHFFSPSVVLAGKKLHNHYEENNIFEVDSSGSFSVGGTPTDAKLTDIMRALLITNSKISKNMKQALTGILPSIPPPLLFNKKAIALRATILQGGLKSSFKRPGKCNILKRLFKPKATVHTKEWLKFKIQKA